MQDEKRDLFKEGYDYAVRVARDNPCVFDNGYKCAANQEAHLPGIYFPYLQIAYADFVNIPDLSAEAKKPVHYMMNIKVDGEHVVVEFSGFLLPKQVTDDKPEGLVLAAVGRGVTYWIGRSSLKVERRLFSR